MSDNNLDATPVAEFRGVSKSYPAAGAPLRVLDDVSLQIAAGETLAIVGPSGSGKSTLLNLLGALDTPDSGEVLFDGSGLQNMDAAALARFRNRDVGLVFQLHHLLPQCTLLENVLIPALIAPDPEAARARAVDLLERAGLGERRDHRPGQLSGGERQRAAAVRALINRPRLLLADEPTGALNEDAAAGLVEWLLEINREEGMALVLVTHASELARRMASVYALHGGRLERSV